MVDTDDIRRTTPGVWHKLPTGELKVCYRSGYNDMFCTYTHISALCIHTMAIANLCNSPPDRASTFLSRTCNRSAINPPHVIQNNKIHSTLNLSHNLNRKEKDR